MNADLERLIKLEQVDREIGRLSAEVAALPKRVADIEHQLSDAKAKVEQAKTAMKSQEQKRRSLESDIQSYQQKIGKFRDQSLDVKTNEQYKALMHEIEFAQDKVLEIMEGGELFDRQVKASETELKTQSAQVDREKEEARALTSKDEARLKELQGERGGLRSGVNEDLLSLYDRVLKARKTALAEAREQRCTACYVLLRPQKWNEIKAGTEILTCDSCGRILFYDPAHEPPPPEPDKKKTKKAKVTAETQAAAASPEAGSLEVSADSPS